MVFAPIALPKKSLQKKSDALDAKILYLLEEGDKSSRELQFMTQNRAEQLIPILQELLESNQIKILPNNKYTLVK